MSRLTLSTAFRSVFRQTIAPLRSLSFSTSARRSATETTQPERPKVGASSLFDNIVVEAAETEEKAGQGRREYCFSSSNFKTSPRKLNMLARQIRNLPVDEAIRQMEFSPKRAAKKILHNLALARKNAKDQFGLENLVISQAWVGKGQYIKRIRPHGRGQFGIMHHKSAHIKFLLKEAPAAEEQQAGKAARRNIRGWHETKKVKMPLIEDKPIYNPKAFYNW